MFSILISQKVAENLTSSYFSTSFLSTKSLCVYILTKGVDYLVRAGLRDPCSDVADAAAYDFMVLIKAEKTMSMLWVYVK